MKNNIKTCLITFITKDLTKYLIILLIALLISACGGGDTDEELTIQDQEIAEETIEEDNTEQDSNIEDESTLDDKPSTEEISVSNTCGSESNPLKIMPLGDSITESEKGHNSFRRRLWKLLKSADCQVDFVGRKKGVSLGYRNSAQATPPNPDFDMDHEARWDYRVDEVLPLINSSIDKYRPDVVLIHLGTNDVLQGESISGTVSEIEILIDSIRARKANTAFIVSRVIPCSRETSRIASLSSKIARLSSKNTKKSPVIIVDQSANYFISDNYDGIHPGNSGEQKIADIYFRAINSLYN